MKYQLPENLVNTIRDINPDSYQTVFVVVEPDIQSTLVRLIDNNILDLPDHLVPDMVRYIAVLNTKRNMMVYCEVRMSVEDNNPDNTAGIGIS